MLDGLPSPPEVNRMGAWGPAILSDDLAADVHADYLVRDDEGAAPEAIADDLNDQGDSSLHVMASLQGSTAAGSPAASG